MTRTSPLVSVIIPAYNPGDHIAQAIDTALEQTYANIEILVIDDASTEDVGRLLSRYDDRVQHVRLEVNRGPSGARNEGIRRAKGDYIAFLDSDDWWAPTRIEKLVDILENRPEIGIATSDIVDVFDGVPGPSWYSSRQTRFRYEDQASSFIKAPFFPPCHSVFRRSLFDRHGCFDEEFMRGEDWDLGIRMLIGGERAGFYPEVLSFVRREEGSLTTWGPWEEDRLRLLEKWHSRGVPREHQRALRDSIARARWDLAKKRLHEGERKEAKTLLRKVLWGGSLDLKMKSALLLVPTGLVRKAAARRLRFLLAHGGPHSLKLAADSYADRGAKGAKGFVAATVLQGEHSAAVRALAAAWLLLPPLRRPLARILFDRAV